MASKVFALSLAQLPVSLGAFAIYAGLVACLTDQAVRGQPFQLGPAFRQALRRVLPMIGTGICVAVLLVPRVLLSILAFVLFLFPGFGGLLPLGLLIWWALSPGARRPWVKRLIILTTPWGLTYYAGLRWSLSWCAVILEGAGPAEAVRRTGQLMRGYWFRLAGLGLVMSFAIWVLQVIPLIVVQSILGATGVREPGGSPMAPYPITMQVFGVLVQAAFGALPLIAYVLAFLDARNRSEGRDLVERVARVEEETAG
jgi:hypothetical protein